MRETLTYKIENGVVIFPLQNEIENLCIALGLAYNRVYDPDGFFIYPNTVLKYSDEHKGWVTQ
jgi:hypothetical protein